MSCPQLRGNSFFIMEKSEPTLQLKEVDVKENDNYVFCVYRNGKENIIKKVCPNVITHDGIVDKENIFYSNDAICNNFEHAITKLKTQLDKDICEEDILN